MRVLFTALAISTLSFLSGVAGDLATPSRVTTQPAQAAMARVSLPHSPVIAVPVIQALPQSIEILQAAPVAAPALYAEALAPVVDAAYLIKPAGKGAAAFSKL